MLGKWYRMVSPGCGFVGRDSARTRVRWWSGWDGRLATFSEVKKLMEKLWR